MIFNASDVNTLEIEIKKKPTRKVRKVILSRFLMVSTNQVDPSCFYFRIS